MRTRSETDPRGTTGRAITLAVFAFALAATPAAAEEILHFANGATMPIRAHEVIDGMIHVDLGGDGMMAFPVSQVEKITEAGQDVYLPPSQRLANIAAEGRRVKVGSDKMRSNRSPSFGWATRSGATTTASKERRRALANSLEERMQIEGQNAPFIGGVGTRQAFPTHPNANARKLAVTGDQSRFGPSVRTSGQVVGSETVGGERVVATDADIDRRLSRGRAEDGVLRFLPKDGVAQKAHTPPPDGSGGRADGAYTKGSGD